MTTHWSKDVRLLAAGASILLSIISVLGKPVPNLDAFTYVRTAEIFLQDGVAAAFNYYPWATYGILIGALQSVTGLDMLVAAHCLNALLFALVVHAFISLAREIDRSRRFTLFAALCILLYPQLNEYRADVIRDVGYLAFSLLALLQLVRLGATWRLRHACLFLLGCFVAALFRPEALAYLVLAPFVLLLNRQQPLHARLRAVFAILAGLATVVLLVALFAGSSDRWLAILADGVTVYRPFLVQATSTITGGSQELAAAIFHEHAAQYSGQYITIFLLTGLLSILVIKLFTGLGWVYLVALAYGLKQRMLQLPRHVALPVAAYLTIGILILLAFVFVTRYLTTRYAMLFSAVLVLLVPVVLERTAARMQQLQKYPLFLRSVGLIVLYLAIDSFISFGESKSYQLDAVEWLQQNLPADARLHTTNPLVAYRLHSTPDYDRLQSDAAALIEASTPGEYLVLDVDDENLADLQDPTANGMLGLLISFPDTADPRLAVYIRQ